MSKIFIKNTTGQSRTFKADSGLFAETIGHIGAVDTSDGKLAVCLSTFKNPDGELVATSSSSLAVSLEGHFVIEVDELVVPYIFTPQNLLEYFDGIKAHRDGYQLIVTRVAESGGEIFNYFFHNDDAFVDINIRIYLVDETGVLSAGDDAFQLVETGATAVEIPLLKSANEATSTSYFGGLIISSMEHTSVTKKKSIGNGSIVVENTGIDEFIASMENMGIEALKLHDYREGEN